MKVYTHTFGRLCWNLSDKVVLIHANPLKAAKRLHVKNVSVIRNGVNLRDFQNTKFPKDLKKKKNEIVVSYIGRLAKFKGYDTIIEAAKKIIKKHDNVTFLFAGGSEIPAKELNSIDKKIRFLGFRKDIPDILAFSDIVLLPSFSEGLSNALMEAMASKKAVIASNVGGNLELVKPNKTGLLVRPGNAKDLEEKIMMLVKNKKLRKSLGKNAFKLIEKKYNWDILAKQWIKEMEDSIKCQ
jgi:glycosyltransferase involved in cell wall biosynthesis